MMTVKSSFTVRFKLPRSVETVTILGVTSVVPNLNGILLFTEDGANYQIEHYEMEVESRYKKSEGNMSWVNMKIEYSTENQIRKHLAKGFESPSTHVCIDGRVS